jgi:hypothetical protein
MYIKQLFAPWCAHKQQLYINTLLRSKFGLESKLGQVWLDFCNGLYYDYIGIVSVFF